MGSAAVIVLVALVAAGVAGSIVAFVDHRRIVATERALAATQTSHDRLRTQLDHLTRSHTETAIRARAVGDANRDELAADAFDAVSGLLKERFVAVLIQQRVAGARRRLHPVAVIALEADGVRGRDQTSVDIAMRALGGVIRDTLREADCACRVGDVVVIAALDCTTEEGARIAIERIQSGLRLATGDVGLTVSAGIACYPTHALEAPDLVARAGQALLDARASGISRIAVAAPTSDPSRS
ncbi:MAG: diguanylate cyclase [Actinobacteria bacterium]|nr:diguanylate cyclase [Actinomycetota bacterium]